MDKDASRIQECTCNIPEVNDIILKDEIGKACYVYVDDILIFSKTEEEHDIYLRVIMEKLIDAGLHGNEKKCKFKQREVEFLGHLLSENKIEPLIEVENTMRNYPRPNNIEEVRRFLGLTNFYRKFIPSCADILEPIAKLVRKDVDFIWVTEQEDSFIKIKEILNSRTVLIQPNYEKEFILETDASNTGLGAVLAQEYQGNIRPIAYASRVLNSTERNYSITEKEMLGALWAMEHFYYYLHGREFVLKTDHKALEAINTKGYLDSARIERWQDRIFRFNFIVEYQKGETIPHVDPLSRQYMNQFVNEVREEKNVTKHDIIRVHENLIHRGAAAVIKQLKEEGLQDINETQVKEVLKGCLKCKMYNPIRSRATRTIEAYSPGEKIGFNIIELEKGSCILVAIDYFTRKGFAYYSTSKTSEKILSFLKEVHKDIGIKTLITDEGRENISKNIKEWLNTENIIQHSTTPYHQSNGRVERFNRTIRESLNKLESPGTLHMRIKEVINKYNQTFHRIIGMSPNEAMNPDRYDEVKRNQYEARIKANTKFLVRGKWMKLKLGDKIIVKDELRKSKKGPRFKVEAVVQEVLEYDTYKIKLKDGKICKRHISQLKKL